MRVLLRVLAPLLGLAVAAVGLITIVEVIAAWVRPVQGNGLLVPWVGWRTALEQRTWPDFPVAFVGIGVAVVGLALLLVALMARRHDIPLRPPAPGVTVTTSPQTLARMVGRRVRGTEGVTAASVTAARRAVRVRAEGWAGDEQDLRGLVHHEVSELLDELPLTTRPRVSVAARGRSGPR